MKDSWFHLESIGSVIQAEIFAALMGWLNMNVPENSGKFEKLLEGSREIQKGLEGMHKSRTFYRVLESYRKFCIILELPRTFQNLLEFSRTLEVFRTFKKLSHLFMETQTHSRFWRRVNSLHNSNQVFIFKSNFHYLKFRSSFPFKFCV